MTGFLTSTSLHFPSHPLFTFHNVTPSYSFRLFFFLINKLLTRSSSLLSVHIRPLIFLTLPFLSLFFLLFSTHNQFLIHCFVPSLPSLTFSLFPSFPFHTPTLIPLLPSASSLFPSFNSLHSPAFLPPLPFLSSSTPIPLPILPLTGPHTHAGTACLPQFLAAVEDASPPPLNTLPASRSSSSIFVCAAPVYQSAAGTPT